MFDFLVSFFLNIIDFGVYMTVGTMILVAFAAIAIFTVKTLLEYKITMVAAYILIPFYLWNKTAFLADGIFKQAFAGSLKLFGLAFMLSIGVDFLEQLSKPGPVDISYTITLGISVMMYAVLVITIPKHLVNLVGGSMPNDTIKIPGL
jgi:type IV secretion system protein TrbL